MLCSDFEYISYMLDNLLQENMKRDDKKSEVAILERGKHSSLFLFFISSFLLTAYMILFSIVVASLVCGCFLHSSEAKSKLNQLRKYRCIKFQITSLMSFYGLCCLNFLRYTEKISCFSGKDFEKSCASTFYPPFSVFRSSSSFFTSSKKKILIYEHLLSHLSSALLTSQICSDISQ